MLKSIKLSFTRGHGHIADLNPSTRTMRARALKIIGPYEIEVSEGVSIFIKGRKNQETHSHKRKDGLILSNFDFLRVGP